MLDPNVIVNIIKEASAIYSGHPNLSETLSHSGDPTVMVYRAIKNEAQQEVFDYFSTRLIEALSLPAEVLADRREEEETPLRISADQYVRET